MSNDLETLSEKVIMPFAYAATVATVYCVSSILNWPNPGETELYRLAQRKSSRAGEWGDRVGLVAPFAVVLAYKALL